MMVPYTTDENGNTQVAYALSEVHNCDERTLQQHTKIIKQNLNFPAHLL